MTFSLKQRALDDAANVDAKKHRDHSKILRDET